MFLNILKSILTLQMVRAQWGYSTKQPHPLRRRKL